MQLIPVPNEQLEKVVTKFQEMGRAIIVGNGLSGIVQGILGGFGFFFFVLSIASYANSVVTNSGCLIIRLKTRAFLSRTPV